MVVTDVMDDQITSETVLAIMDQLKNKD